MRIAGLMFAVLMVIIPSGCAYKRATYATAGGLAGGGIGYAINKDPKDAAIGGLAGTGAGYVIGDLSEKSDKKKYQDGFKEGYAQAQANIASDHWDENTGKQADPRPQFPLYRRIKIPKKEINGVVYEEHYETVEVMP
jgi:hypothetical protein